MGVRLGPVEVAQAGQRAGEAQEGEHTGPRAGCSGPPASGTPAPTLASAPRPAGTARDARPRRPAPRDPGYDPTPPQRRALLRVAHQTLRTHPAAYGTECTARPSPSRSCRSHCNPFLVRLLPVGPAIWRIPKRLVLLDYEPPAGQKMMPLAKGRSRRRGSRTPRSCYSPVRCTHGFWATSTRCCGTSRSSSATLRTYTDRRFVVGGRSVSNTRPRQGIAKGPGRWRCTRTGGMFKGRGFAARAVAVRAPPPRWPPNARRRR